MKTTISHIGIVFVVFLACKPPDAPEPVIQKINPQSGAPGSDFTVVGHNLNYVSKVMLDSYSLNFAVLDNDTLVAKVPGNIPFGSYSLYVTFKDGKSKGLSFTVIKPKPLIEKIYPLSAYTGDTLEITGSSFEDNNLEVHIADMVTKQFLEVTDTLIRLIVTENFKPGDLTVVNSNGTSNSKFFNFLGEEADPIPIVLSVYPNKGFPLGEIRITGKNFKREKLHIVFPPQIELTENIGFVVQSDTILVLTIPEGGSTGNITIENVYGTVSASIEVVQAPVITRILPAGNKAGGPMLIYGRNLKQVKSLRFGDNPLINGFGYFTTNENEEIIALPVPKITPGKVDVRAEINDAMFSNALPYTLYEGEMSLPEYMPSIVIPNSPPANIADELNNDWISMIDTSSTIKLDQSYEDPTVVLGDGDSIGFINDEDNSIVMNNAYGKLDQSYYTPDANISRLILTPLDSGNQYEMITPIYLESVEPAIVSQGGELFVKARYFIHGWHLNIYDFDEYRISYYHDEFDGVFISINLIKINLPEDIAPGEYNLEVNIREDSNIRTFTVVAK